MAVGVYDIGDLVTCGATFATVAGVSTDPDVVNFGMRSPDGTKTSYIYLTDAELIKDDTGDYHVDVTPLVSGTWFYEFTGVGTINATEEGKFFVRESRV